MGLMYYPRKYGYPVLATQFYGRSKVAQRQNRSYSRTYTQTQRKKRPATSYSLNRRIMETKPAKHCPFSDVNVASAKHNNIYTWGPSQLIGRGVNDDQRIGDEVYLEAIKLNYFVSTLPASDKAVEVRVLVLYSGEEYNCPVTFISTGLSGSELFVTNPAGGWMPNSLTNPKAVTVLDDRRIILNNSITGVADLESLAYTVQLKTKFPYQAGGSQYGKLRNLYVVVIGSILDGVTGTTQWGQVQVSADLIFRS